MSLRTSPSGAAESPVDLSMAGHLDSVPYPQISAVRKASVPPSCPIPASMANHLGAMYGTLHSMAHASDSVLCQARLPSLSSSTQQALNDYMPSSTWPSASSIRSPAPEASTPIYNTHRFELSSRTPPPTGRADLPRRRGRPTRFARRSGGTQETRVPH